VPARTLLIAAVVAACAAAGEEPRVTAARPDAPPCPAAPDAAPLDHNSVEIGGRYFVDVALENGEWVPASHVPMPMHHATRVEWQNPEKLAELGAAASGRLRFTFTAESRDISQVPGRHAWRVVLHAKITAICRPA
jgi:hypothetical protein